MISTMAPKTLLEAIEGVCNVDVDAVDPRVSTALPFKPHNQTSNQVICADTMLLPEYKDMFQKKVADYGSKGWEEVFNRVSVQFCADNLENISNRVLVQVSPTKIYDEQAVLENCYAYDRMFKEAGISRDRYAIKISATGPAMSAAAQLKKDGIRTLATSLFSLPQAIAASQAGCLYISPYFNEVAAYSDDNLLHKSDDPALNHPMSPRIIHILEAYTQLYKETGREQPLFVMASNANVNEVVATAELGCQHITILANHLKELASVPFDSATQQKYPWLKSPPSKRQSPYYKDLQTPERLKGHAKIDLLADPAWDGKLADIHVDYIADHGKALTNAIAADPAVIRKLKDVVDAFVGGEQKAQKAIEVEWAKVKA